MSFAKRVQNRQGYPDIVVETPVNDSGSVNLAVNAHVEGHAGRLVNTFVMHETIYQLSRIMGMLFNTYGFAEIANFLTQKRTGCRHIFTASS